MEVVSGNVKVIGTIAYVAQEPWIFPGTVQENIIFDRKFDSVRYRSVIEACALSEEIQGFSNGHHTYVGDKGIALSGGQKARVSLARALYADADIYLLDDPLSALDIQVASNIFRSCILGYLKNKVRILVTHQAQLLHRLTDGIVVLKEGRIESHGSYQSIETPVMRYIRRISADVQPFTMGLSSSLSELDVCDSSWNGAKMDGIKEYCIDNEPVKEENKCKEGSQQKEEKLITTAVGLRTFYSYLNAGWGLPGICLIFLLTVMLQTSICFCDYWISYWSESETSKHHSTHNLSEEVTHNDTVLMIWNQSLSSSQCLIVFISIVILLTVFAFVHALVYFIICIKSSSKLHQKMLQGVTNTSISFFCQNPIGRILNRFSKDIGEIDDWIPIRAIDTLKAFSAVIGSAVLVGITNVWLAAVFLAFFLLVGISTKIFTKTVVVVKRLDAIARGQFCAYLNACIRGSATIKAFKATESVIQQLNKLQDCNTSIWFTYISMNRWLGIWLDCACFAVITATALFLTLVRTSYTGGEIGLALYSVIQIIGIVQWGVREFAESTSLMTSVERDMEYGNLQPEECSKSKSSPESHWPAVGTLQFIDVAIMYDEEIPPDQKCLNFFIKGGEKTLVMILYKEMDDVPMFCRRLKVGIVGRTGSGKSSLFSAVLRLWPVRGSVLLDGIDINNAPLEILRKAIAVIPQEPTLFCNTLRFNLDPTGKHSDEELWDALDRVNLKKSISLIPSALNTSMTDGILNFSIGQRQLLCLARAIVQKARIIFVDEATASMDHATEEEVRKVILDNFNDHTVLVIAHRLYTVMNFDKIMVMDAGNVVEFDSPKKLLQTKTSAFRRMVKKSGCNATISYLEAIRKQSINRDVYDVDDDDDHEKSDDDF